MGSFLLLENDAEALPLLHVEKSLCVPTSVVDRVVV
jgi:hypothetical protein